MICLFSIEGIERTESYWEELGSVIVEFKKSSLMISTDTLLLRYSYSFCVFSYCNIGYTSAITIQNEHPPFSIVDAQR